MNSFVRLAASAAAAYMASSRVPDDRTVKIVSAVVIGFSAWLVLPVLFGDTDTPRLSGDSRRALPPGSTCGSGGCAL